MTKPMSHLVTDACHAIAVHGIDPSRIVFNIEGHIRAKRENTSAIDRFGYGAQNYMGLPYTVDHRQEELVKVFSVEDDKPKPDISIKMDLAEFNKGEVTMNLEELAKRLTIAQMSDFVKSWCNAHASTDLAIVLAGCIFLHGKFED